MQKDNKTKRGIMLQGVPLDLLKKVDKKAKSLGTTRSAIIKYYVDQGLKRDE